MLSAGFFKEKRVFFCGADEKNARDDGSCPGFAAFGPYGLFREEYLFATWGEEGLGTEIVTGLYSEPVG